MGGSSRFLSGKHGAFIDFQKKNSFKSGKVTQDRQGGLIYEFIRSANSPINPAIPNAKMITSLNAWDNARSGYRMIR